MHAQPSLIQPVAVTGNARATHFERIGGAEPIALLAERFYHHMDTQPEAAAIRAMHPADLTPVRKVLELFLVEWMGGSKDYSAMRGHPRLRMRHMEFPLGVAARDAWMNCMRAALNEVVTDAELKTQLEAAFFKTADFIRNQQENHHDNDR
ncbi:group II truncated hemoglobin [Uliginosibacterium sp. TH139]|uniref:group II truncated hemoglobin n=1 Tax=Uliginosibacterium sp. TH139 TaxID=2067453 RepID=UPI000C79D604|nr:group II truncated hemoglobin [Uliginosibacterium sp. TH139]PLK47486.1 globin [Uliginosibacterium sp. TH139]